MFNYNRVRTIDCPPQEAEYDPYYNFPTEMYQNLPQNQDYAQQDIPPYDPYFNTINKVLLDNCNPTLSQLSPNLLQFLPQPRSGRLPNCRALT